jgi:hypothetical protein
MDETPRLLCMWCGQPACPEHLNLTCSLECLADLAEAHDIPPGPDAGGRIWGVGYLVKPSNRRWRGTSIQELGVAALGSEIGNDIPARTAPHPLILRRLEFENDGVPDVLYVHVWLAIVRFPDLDIAVQARWHPYLEQTLFSFMNVPYNVTGKQLDKARRALILWREEQLGGRPLSSHTGLTQDAWLAQARAMREERSRRISWKKISQINKIDWRTAKAWVEELEEIE